MANLYCHAVRKKKAIVETTDYTKRARKLFKRPPQMSKVQNHNDSIIQPTERDCIVKCGIHVVANSGAEVIFHLSVTTGYALTVFVVY